MITVITTSTNIDSAVEILGTETVVVVVVVPAAAEVAAIVEACEVPIAVSGHFAPVVLAALGMQSSALLHDFGRNAGLAADLAN